VENEQRTTYGIAEWAATLRAQRTEKELAAVAAGIRECQAARRSSPQPPQESASAKPRGGARRRNPMFHPRLPAALVPKAEWGVATYRG
jgi:hypothetical protein